MTQDLQLRPPAAASADIVYQVLRSGFRLAFRGQVQCCRAQDGHWLLISAAVEHVMQRCNGA